MIFLSAREFAERRVSKLSVEDLLSSLKENPDNFSQRTIKTTVERKIFDDQDALAAANLAETAIRFKAEYVAKFSEPTYNAKREWATYTAIALIRK